MFSIFLILISLSILSSLIVYHTRKRKFRSLSNVPEFKSYPVIGSLMQFGYSTVDIFKNLVRLGEEYKHEPFAKMWLGPWHCYLLSINPEFVEFILSSPKHITKSVDYDILRSFVDNGLVTSTGSYWHKHRKLVNSAFHLKVLESYVPIYNTKSNILIEILTNQVDKGDFDVYPYIVNCVFDVICESAMGTPINAQTTDNELAKNVRTLATIILKRVFSIWKKFEILYQFSHDYKEEQKLIMNAEQVTKLLIEARKNELINQNNEETEIDDFGIKKKRTFLDTLLLGTIDGKPLTDREILKQVNTIITAGYDTTSSLLALTLYELSRNPEVQNKLFLEIKKLYNNNKNYEPTVKDLDNLTYTKLVLKESLRLYPSVPIITRQFEEDVDYKGTTLPKGTIIALFLYGMQRREDLFPQANTFNPDRFLSQNETFTPFSYVPFSAGPRNCIGQKFSMHEATAILSKIIMNFEIVQAESKADVQLACEIFLTATTGVPIRLKRRKI